MAEHVAGEVGAPGGGELLEKLDPLREAEGRVRVGRVVGEDVDRRQSVPSTTCEGSMDNPVGLVHVKDLLRHIGKKPIDLRSIARPLRRVPETMPARSLLHEMQKAGPHMVAVVDEHGTTVGLATLETLLEQIVGPVEDEFDEELPELEVAGESEYRVRGSISMRRLSVELELDLSGSSASTLSGHVVAHLGRFPVVGDVCEFDGMSVEVVQVDKGRATQLLVRTLDEPTPPDGDGKLRTEE